MHNLESLLVTLSRHSPNAFQWAVLLSGELAEEKSVFCKLCEECVYISYIFCITFTIKRMHNREKKQIMYQKLKNNLNNTY